MRDIMNAKLKVGFALSLMLMSMIGIVGAQAVVTETASVPVSSCSVSLDSQAVTYAVTPGALVFANPSYITVSNTGNVAGTFYVQGNDWVDQRTGADLGSSSIAYTTYSLGSDTSANAAYMSSTPTGIGTLGAGGSQYIRLGLTMPVDTPADSYGQSVTVSASC